jgi:hypothetical protein
MPLIRRIQYTEDWDHLLCSDRVEVVAAINARDGMSREETWVVP